MISRKHITIPSFGFLLTNLYYVQYMGVLWMDCVHMTIWTSQVKQTNRTGNNLYGFCHTESQFKMDKANQIDQWW